MTKKLVKTVEKQLEHSLAHQDQRTNPQHFSPGTFPKMLQRWSRHQGPSTKARARRTKNGNQRYQRYCTF